MATEFRTGQSYELIEMSGSPREPLGDTSVTYFGEGYHLVRRDIALKSNLDSYVNREILRQLQSPDETQKQNGIHDENDAHRPAYRDVKRPLLDRKESHIYATYMRGFQVAALAGSWITASRIDDLTHAIPLGNLLYGNELSRNRDVEMFLLSGPASIRKDLLRGFWQDFINLIEEVMTLSQRIKVLERALTRHQKIASTFSAGKRWLKRTREVIELLMDRNHSLFENLNVERSVALACAWEITGTVETFLSKYSEDVPDKIYKRWQFHPERLLRLQHGNERSGKGRLLSAMILLFRDQFSLLGSTPRLTGPEEDTDMAEDLHMTIGIVMELINTNDTRELFLAAREDPDVGPGELCTIINKTIFELGASLYREAESAFQKNIATYILVRVPAHVVYTILKHSYALQPDTIREVLRVGRWELDGPDVTGLIAEMDDVPEGKRLSEACNFVQNSSACFLLKECMLEEAHEPYEKRLAIALGHDLVGEDGGDIDLLAPTVSEASWVPPSRLSYTSDRSSSVSEFLKGHIEGLFGERWDWWPLAPQLRPLQSHRCRLRWHTPSGRVSYLDFPSHAQQRVADAISSAPAFMSIAQTRVTSPNVTSQASPAGGTSGWNISPNLETGRGIRPQRTHASLSQRRTSEAPTTLEEDQNMRAVQQPREGQHVYLCVTKGTSHKVFDLVNSTPMNDFTFFANLKQAYFQGRGQMRRHFSMWRYHHCEFYEFTRWHTTQIDVLRPGFPDRSDFSYAFKPRPPTHGPPIGPITRRQFEHYFYHGPPSWKTKHQEKLYIVVDSAFKAAPKRKEPLRLDDPNPESFFGLWAVEQRCFAGVVAYFFLALIPSVVFFFWWSLHHKPGELSNAAVPLTLTMTSFALVLGYMIGSREAR